MNDDKLIDLNDVPCCPELTKEPCCDRLQFTYRLENRQSDIPVEITIVAELERCPGPLALGDVVYSNTLLPGERIRLQTANRNNRFTYDKESEVSYRHEQASEETYYMSAMDRSMSDLNITSNASGSTESESDFQTEGSVSNWSSAIFGRPNARVEGEFSAESSFDFMSELSRHAESSHERSVQGTRAANSIAVGEVQSRTHTEGESESAYEASVRTIENKNKCHAVTYFAYQLVKRQTVSFRIKAVLRRVKDPAGDSGVDPRPIRPNAHIAVIPNGVLSTNSSRLDIETAGRTSAAANRANLITNVGGAGLIGAANTSFASLPLRGAIAANRVKPVATAARERALAQVDEALVKAGIIDQVGGKVSAKLQAEFGFSKTTCLPTQAMVIKGCIDNCNVCEPSRQRAIELDLVRKELENKYLERQIALLEKSQEYRCCPEGEVEDTEHAPTGG